MKKQHRILLTLILMLSSFVIYSQDPPKPADNPPVPGLPINTFIPALLLAGVYYGIKSNVKK